jgi:hypothetical protein
MNEVASQLEVQKTVYGVDPSKLSGDDKARYIRENVLAATEELHEILRCYAWKPWGINQGVRLASRDEVKEEIIDVRIFLNNLAAVEGITDEELAEAYAAKLKKNASRPDHGAMTL